MESSEVNGQLEAILSGEPLSGAYEDNNLSWRGQDQPSQQDGVLCRLCADPCGNISSYFLFKTTSENTVERAVQNLHAEAKSDEGAEADNADLMVLIDKTLPIKVSQSDPLPKQVCVKCVERLRESYSFVLSVINAESRLRAMVDKKTFCASEVSPQDEGSNRLPSPNPGLVRVTLPSGPKYCCPLCDGGIVGPSCEPPIPLVKKLVVPEKASWEREANRSNVAWDGTMIKLERDCAEPTPEEMERSYRDLFDVRDWRPEKRSFPRSQPAPRRGYKGRPRGRPRGRTKMIPRGKRGSKRLTHTTVERILELSGSDMPKNNDVVRVRSGSDRLHADALTQCLLCEGWLPGMAACLQHALTNHTDCGVFLCPRCQQDDFPGEFELIQHFQEHHCPDLELCEGSDDDSLGAEKSTAAPMEFCDSDIPPTPSMHSEDTDLTRPPSGMSTRTGSVGADVTEKDEAEIKQNGDTNGIPSQELTVNTFLEHKESVDFKDLHFVVSEGTREISMDGDIVPSITEESQLTDEPGNDNEEVDEEDPEEPDAKMDTTFEYRKDSEDPEGGGGNSSSGNSNNLVDDNTSSFENGDVSSHSTQKGDQTDCASGTDCGNSLTLSSLQLSPKKILRRNYFARRGANYGRKPKRKQLRSTVLNPLPKRTSLSFNCCQPRSHLKSGSLKGGSKKCEIASCRTSRGRLRNHSIHTPMHNHQLVQRTKVA